MLCTSQRDGSNLKHVAYIFEISIFKFKLRSLVPIIFKYDWFSDKLNCEDQVVLAQLIE